tara:strand:+ start:2565 stop:3083 length:519 start_codon:yes stop_codon:yes gene_type:complete
MNKHRSLSVLLTLIFAPGIVSAAGADQDLHSGIRQCAGITDTSQRLACFDALAGKLASVSDTTSIPVPAPAPAANPVPSQEPAVLPGVAARPATESEKDNEEFAVKVMRCEKSNVSERLYFHLENGQVWRQSNTGRLRLRECDFDATIVKDLIGYKMTIPSEKRSFRVALVR